MVHIDLPSTKIHRPQSSLRYASLASPSSVPTFNRLWVTGASQHNQHHHAARDTQSDQAPTTSRRKRAILTTRRPYFRASRLTVWTPASTCRTPTGSRRTTRRPNVWTSRLTTWAPASTCRTTRRPSTWTSQLTRWDPASTCWSPAESRRSTPQPRPLGFTATIIRISRHGSRFSIEECSPNVRCTTVHYPSRSTTRSRCRSCATRSSHRR